MLAGPIPRKTNRFNIGSFDQLIGVGVGLGAGVAAAARVGAGLCEGAGLCDAGVCVTFSACTAQAPNVITNTVSVQIAAVNPRISRARSLVSFIGEILSAYVVSATDGCLTDERKASR